MTFMLVVLAMIIIILLVIIIVLLSIGIYFTYYKWTYEATRSKSTVQEQIDPTVEDETVEDEIAEEKTLLSGLPAVLFIPPTPNVIKSPPTPSPPLRHIRESRGVCESDD